MTGYRQNNLDLGPDQPERPKSWPWWQVVGLTLGYMIPLFWLWTHIDYPDSFGVHITAHGKAGLFENWFYSYLLVKRHDPLDDVTFLYMWAPLLAAIGWFAFRKLRGTKLSLYTDDEASQ